MIILPIIIFLLVGILIYFLIFKKLETSSIGFGYGMGTGLIAVEMLVLSLVGIEWNLFVLMIPWFCLLVYLFPKFSKNKPHISIPLQGILKIFFGMLILLLVLFTLFEAVIRPVTAWDAWAHWLLGANAFYYDRFVSPDFFQYANISYPPLIGLMGTFTFLIIGYTSNAGVLLMFNFFYIALLILFYSAVCFYMNPKVAIVYTFILASIQNIIRQAGRYEAGNADLPLAYFFLAAAILLLKFINNRKTSYLITLELFLGIGALIKNEGIIFLLIVNAITVYFLIRWKDFKKIPFVVISLGMAAVWYGFSWYHHLPQNPFITGMVHFDRLPVITLLVIEEMIQVIRWNIIWPLFFLILPFVTTKEEKIVILIFFLQLAAYITVYLMTPTPPVAHFHNSFDRLLLQITPLSVLATALISGKLIKRFSL